MMRKMLASHTVFLSLLRMVVFVFVATAYVSVPADIEAPAAVTRPLLLNNIDRPLLSLSPYLELYRDLPGRMREVAPDGAIGINSKWERHRFSQWYIEEQRYAWDILVGGLLLHNPRAIDVALRAFTWGFAHQARDGSFRGTSDAFHSTSFFVEAAAHSLLLLRASSYRSRYHHIIQQMTHHVHKAATWMIQPHVWRPGVSLNRPFTHRRYLVAAALGLTGKLTHDATLVAASRAMIRDGLSLQTPQGYNPEKGGYDNSYQMVGITYAEAWRAYFPHDPLAPGVSAMIEKGLQWEATRIFSNGKLNTNGNTRTAGQETGRDGVKVKTPAYKSIAAGFLYWGIVKNDRRWIDLGLKVHDSK